MSVKVKKANVNANTVRTFDRKLMKAKAKSKIKEDVHIIRGFYLPPALYKVCLAELKSYKYLQRNLDSMLANGEKLTHFAECVEKKINVELKLEEMDMAFASIPEKYRAPMTYMLHTEDPEHVQRMKLEHEYNLEYKEAREWLKKLVYFYAEAAGYPVSHSGASYSMEVSDDGDVVIVYL